MINYKKRSHIIYGTFLFLTILFILFNNSYSYFWYDEGFTMSIIRYSFSDIWNHSAKDVHPPLYYFILKIYALLTGDSAWNLRLFSSFPILISVLLGCTIVRRLWGDKTAVFFILLILLSPITQYMCSEIRMYSWGMLFVLLAALFAYMGYEDGKKSIYNIFFVFFSLCAAYTQYYALLAVAYIYFLYFIFCVIYKKDRVVLSIILGILFLIGFSPWLHHLLAQVGNVTSSGEWWMKSNFMAGLIEYFYPVQAFQKLDIPSLSYRAAEIFIFIAFFVYVIVNAVKSGQKRKFVDAIIAGSVFLFPIIIGITYSYLIKPVFHPRYVSCTVGLYFLSFALLLSMIDFSKRINKIIVSVFFILFSIYSIAYLIGKLNLVKNRDADFKEMAVYINNEDNGKTAILYDKNLSLPFPILFSDITHLCKKDTTEKATLIMDVSFVINNAFDYTLIPSYNVIDTAYHTVFAIDVLNHQTDSLVLSEHFDIVDKRNIRGFNIYKLSRKSLMN